MFLHVFSHVADLKFSNGVLNHQQKLMTLEIPSSKAFINYKYQQKCLKKVCSTPTIGCGSNRFLKFPDIYKNDLSIFFWFYKPQSHIHCLFIYHILYSTVHDVRFSQNNPFNETVQTFVLNLKMSKVLFTRQFGTEELSLYIFESKFVMYLCSTYIHYTSVNLKCLQLLSWAVAVRSLDHDTLFWCYKPTENLLRVSCGVILLSFTIFIFVNHNNIITYLGTYYEKLEILQLHAAVSRLVQ